MHRIRIVIADDHPLLRKGLREVIEEDSSLRVVGEAVDGDTALEQIERLRPDIVVADIGMPRRDGLALVREMQARKLTAGVIFLTLHSDAGLFNQAIDLGAKGYILKDSALTAIVDAIKAVASGQHFFTQSLTGLLVRRRAAAQALAASQPRLVDLTPTERRILQLIASGQSSKEIANALFIHYRTVENHRVNIAQKLGLRGHNAVLKFALEHRMEL
jgi:DNA-binding NarL/FixJ family response regulator